MSKFDFDKSVEIALRTWYPIDHELHLNPHHPLMKLTGEWGELLDDYAKSIYKPDYVFEPLDELGDIWYYLRILAYQTDIVSARKIEKVTFSELDFILIFSEADIDIIIGAMQYSASKHFLHSQNDSNWIVGVKSIFINIQYSGLFEICRRYNITLQELTDSNWEKLKPGSERGNQWMKARIKLNYVGGKVTSG